MEKILNKAGVYCIQNKHNGKIYIGSSDSIRRRKAMHKSNFKRKLDTGNSIMIRVYKKYGIRDMKFFVLMYTEDYIEWETLLINLLKPEYNTGGMENGKLQPNLGKKFSQEWKDNLHKCAGHSKITRKKLEKLNKEGGCKLIFTKGKEILSFNTWVEASIYFKGSSPSSIGVSFKRKGTWKGWTITRKNTQKKKVLLSNGSKTKEFNSSAECDRFLNLWRGATSNAIKNKNGKLHNYRVEYI